MKKAKFDEPFSAASNAAVLPGTPCELAALIKKSLQDKYAPDVVKIGLIGQWTNVRHAELTYTLAEEGTPTIWGQWKPNGFRLGDPSLSYSLIAQQSSKPFYHTDAFAAARSEALPKRYRAVPLRLESEITSGVIVPIRTRLILGSVVLHWESRPDADVRNFFDNGEEWRALCEHLERLIFKHRGVWKHALLKSLGLSARQIDIVNAASESTDAEVAAALGITTTSLARAWKTIANQLGKKDRRSVKPMIFHYQITGWLHSDDALDKFHQQALTELLESDSFWMREFERCQ